ncbi:glycoside hydrolase family 43 protein [Metabacillus niabensis]|uniref:glycoside hydrolase family 43 protein n=1 Tax=Metabacillus niabensis TaxID=324854 RepID=UPI001CFA8054|nr:glycoside hydrolase family 43 protein [Metabacillus niabensis]
MGDARLSDKEMIESIKKELEIPHADDIRGNISLPLSIKGATISWETSRPDIVNVKNVKIEGYDDIPAGIVSRPETDTPVLLTASITIGELSETKHISLTVKAKPGEMSFQAYLMVHFTGEHEKGEQIYFACSTDGLNWSDLNSGKPILLSDIGEKGVRDPFILRSAEGDKFFIIATDLRIANGRGWDAAQTAGSKSIIVWESNDLVNWSDPWMIEVAPQNAGDAWAPEAIYDEKTGEYIVFWASRVLDEGEFGTHNIYYAKTRDFYTFTNPNVYIERPEDTHIIDTTIIRDNKMYYRYSGDGQITIEKSEQILGSWKKIGTLEASTGLTGKDVEGPLIFKFHNKKEWCLLVDQYATGKGYLPLLTRDLSSCEFEIVKTTYSLGSSKKRHGSVLSLTNEEYEAIKTKWGAN